MYSFHNFEPVHCFTSSSNCCFFTWTQILKEEDRVVCNSHLFKYFWHFVVVHTIKGFSIVNKADIFLEFPCFFYNSTNVGNLISGSSAFSKSSLNIWKFSVHILLKPSLEDFEHYLAHMWNEHSCMVVSMFFDIAILWDWNENGLFQSWPLLSFPNLLAYGVQHFKNIIF